MQEKIEEMEKELLVVKKHIDSGKGDFMALMDKEKELTDSIRAMKLEVEADEGPEGAASSEAICNDDDTDGDETNNESFDIEM